MQANKGVELVVNTVMAIQGVALFNALSEAGQVQPDVSGRMGVAGVTANSISYHSLSAIGGASGGPLVSTKLAVVGINHAGFGEQDRGSQFQQAEAVPIDFAWRFLPAGLGHAK
jgi:S1-C subfamily serine protease